MKKGFAIALALVLLFTAGCSKQAEQPAPTAAPTIPEITAVPETTAPETEPPMPKLETGIVQGDNIPAILCQLKKGDLVEVTGNPDDTHVTVKTEFGTGTMETQLLRFAGEAQPESWTGYARWNTGLYESYELAGEALATLKTNTKVEVVEELEDCYLVTVDGETGFAAKAQVSKWPVKSSSGSSDGGSSGSSDGGNSGSSSGGSFTGRDGGDIALAFYGKVHLLSSLTKTGSAQVRVDGAKVVFKYFDLGDTVQIVAEEGFAPALPGFLPILVDDTYAYIPQSWVHKDADPAFESWEGFAGYNCKLYDNYLLRGKEVKWISGNTALTVLWTAADVSVIRVGDTIGYVSTDTLRTTRLPAQKPQEDTGGSSSGGTSGSGGGSSSGGSEWTPPAL